MNLSDTGENIMHAGRIQSGVFNPQAGQTVSSVNILQDADAARWDRYVLESDKATCYHLSGWKSVIERSFRHKTYYLFAEDNSGRIQGILPIVNLKSILFGNFMVSMPYFNYGGICSAGDDFETRLMNAAIDLAVDHKATHIEFRHSHPLSGQVPVKTAKVAMHLKLPAEADELWKFLPSKLRSQIRRPVKEDMYASVGGGEYLDDFYDIFAENMRDLGTPVYGKDFFRNILKQFPSTTRICTVFTKEGKAVASGFLVGFKKVLEIPWASSLRNRNSSSPNMLMYWTSLKYACENGYDTFDFGRSTPGEGTYNFKEQWGAKPVQLFWHYWLKKNGPLPELNPHNPKYELAIRIWRKLPLQVTNLLGPAIVRNLP